MVKRLSFICLMAVYACTTQTKSIIDNEKQIRERRIQSNKAIQQHDSVGVAEYWTEDYRLVSSRNFEVSGREANRKSLSREFQSKKDVVYKRVTSRVEIFESWNMAAENGEWVGNWSEADGLVNLSGTYYAKWHKVDGVWRIRAEIFTPLKCSGSKFCLQQPKIN